MEDKQKICDLFLKVLQETREYSDVIDLVYYNGNYKNYIGLEIVVMRFSNGAEKIANVTLDSGSVMLSDILRQC